ncbi:MAG TPA: histidinol-phosphatase [Phycisphaerae bacterium]|nr:histidinol-phosphatase [Phycisphaerae bacterium]
MHRRLWIVAALSAVVLCGGAGKGPAVRQEIVFPDLPGLVTLKCDFHLHTVFSDGKVWPTVRVDEAWREGLDAIALTDHIGHQSHKQDVSTDANRPHDIALGRAKERDILLIRGGELTHDTPPGHYNAIFLNDVNALDVKDLFEQAGLAAAQGAFIFWNHPGWRGPEKGRWGEAQSRLLEAKQLGGIEVCNGLSYYVEAHRWALDRKLAIIGTSDLHDPSLYVERTPEDHRTITLVFAKERSVEGIREALQAGRTAAWFQNHIIGKEAELSALFAACVQVAPAHHSARNMAWARVHNCSELDIELVRVGADLSDARQKRAATTLLPAKTTSVVQFPAAGTGDSATLKYQALNFLVGPEEPMAVQLVASLPPSPSTMPANAPARK